MHATLKFEDGAHEGSGASRKRRRPDASCEWMETGRDDIVEACAVRGVLDEEDVEWHELRRRGVDRHAPQSRCRPRRLRYAGNARGAPGYDEGDNAPVPASSMAVAGVGVEGGPVGASLNDGVRLVESCMADGVVFSSGRSWRKLRLDGGYMAQWRARGDGRYGCARACCPDRSVSGDRSPAVVFEPGLPRERGTALWGSDRLVVGRAQRGFGGALRAW